jgi:transposase
MKTSYFLGIDAAKHKIRAALSDKENRLLWQSDLAVSVGALRQLLAKIKTHVPHPKQLLVLIEATGMVHLNWSAALTRAGYAVAVINPLIARWLYRVENSIRDNKTDAIDARGLCTIGALHGEKLLALYRFYLKPEQFALQRLQGVRKALRSSLTNLKKTYQSLLELSFAFLGQLLELDGVGIGSLLSQAPTPAAIMRMRRSSLEKNWMLRPKAAALKLLASDSIADPQLAAASAPALQLLLRSLASLEAQLHKLDQKSKALMESLPGVGAINSAKLLAWLPNQILHSGNNRKVAARLQAFMGNDPRLRQSGQWKGHTKMSKRGVEMLRSAFFQCAFSAAQNDPELRAYYLRKPNQGKTHEVAVSHLMRILTRRLVAVLRSGKPYSSNHNLVLQSVV